MRLATFSRHFLRLLSLARTLARHDALFALEAVKCPRPLIWGARLLALPRRNGKTPGERLALALQEMGPSFVKFGQALSVRPDLVGEEIAASLSLLQDRLPPFPARYAHAIVRKELGHSLINHQPSTINGQLFSSFDDTPAAAASIAQVHFAADADGKEWAVKILRPGIEKRFRRDLELFYWLADMLERRDEAKRLKPREVVAEFARAVSMEMDFRMEAAAAGELAENSKNDGHLYVPAIDWTRTSQRVLTSERIAGVRIDDCEALIQAGHDPADISRKLAETFFLQVFRDGFFHADLHPGNLFVTKEGQIALVDFGIMGRLGRPTRIYLARMLLGFLNRDYMEAAHAHFDAGYVPLHHDVAAFAQACRAIGEPVLGRPQAEVSIARLLALLFKITRDFDMETQPQLLLLQKTMVMLEGLGKTLTPEVNFWEYTRSLAEKWVKENLGMRGRAGLIREEALALHRDAREFLRLASGMGNIITPEGIKLHPETVRLLARENRQSSRHGAGVKFALAAVTILIALALLW